MLNKQKYSKTSKKTNLQKNFKLGSLKDCWFASCASRPRARPDGFPTSQHYTEGSAEDCQQARSHQPVLSNPIPSGHSCGISLTLWGLKAAECLPSPVLTSPPALYHKPSTCWPFLWSCYSGWSVGWRLRVCFECVNVWVGVCVSHRHRGRMGSGRHSHVPHVFSGKSSSLLFTLWKQISVGDTVSLRGKNRKSSRGLKGKIQPHQSFTVQLWQCMSKI